MNDDERCDAPSLYAVLAYARDVLGRSGLTTGQQAVAWFVVSCYNRREGCARPSQAAIARDMGLHEDSVYRALRAITAAGVWAADRTNRRATRYRFPLAAAVHSPRVDAGVELSTSPAETRGGPRAHAGAAPAHTRGEPNNEPDTEPVVRETSCDAVPRGARAIELIELGYAL